MASPSTPHGQCKCCLKTTYLKNMWEPQEYNGTWEVYGQMLVDCFGIDWTILMVEEDNICQVCISKLRVATTFKQQVQESQAATLQNVDVTAIEDTESTHRVKVETIPTLNGMEVEVTFVPTTPSKNDIQPPSTNKNLNKTPSSKRSLNETYLERKNNCPLEEDNSITIPFKMQMTTDLKNKHDFKSTKKVDAAVLDTKRENMTEIAVNKDNRQTTKKKKMTDNLKKKQVQNEDNSILNTETIVEDDTETVTYITDNYFTDDNEDSLDCDEEEAEKRAFEDVEFLEEDLLELKNEDDEDFEPQSKKAKPTIGKPRGKRKMYKNYTEEDVRRAVQAVRAHEMSRSEAARVFKVPRKTIGLKAQLFSKEERIKEDIFMKQLIKAVQALLTYTNATPFKVSCQGNNFKCFFCTHEEPVLQLPKDLRLHSHTKHPDKIKQTEFAVRPRYLNQMVRIDIHNLKCECNKDVTWENMLEHLQHVHGVTEIDEAWEHIVPYDLSPSDDVQCVFESCDYSGCFNKLDSHMNKHFPNYLCGACGKPFVTDVRLRGHSQLHEVGEYRCNECPEIFTTRLKRKLHKDRVHHKKLLYKCVICSDRFETIAAKMSHLRSEHQDMVQSKGKYCNLCGLSFWARDFLRHMKFEHNKHMCRKCGKRFDRATRLKAHACNPENPVKNYKCTICMKLFFTKEAVLVHISQKHNQVQT